MPSYTPKVESGLTRGRFLQRSLLALSSAGIYGLVDGLAAPAARAFAHHSARPGPEQHLLQNVRQLSENGVEVLIPPLHHQIVTANLRVGRSKAALHEARRTLEGALATIDRTYAPTPSGLGLTVGWSRRYFEDRLPRLAGGRRYPDYLPVDHRASQAAGEHRAGLLDAIRFPSDPDDVVLEHNDVCFLFRSDVLAHVEQASQHLFHDVHGMFDITSIRKGFVGGGLEDGVGLPKKMATQARIPGAELMPDAAQLFLGFTSTQKRALGPGLIANTETLPGLTDQWPNGYFRHGTTMHVSHIHEDLETWYASFSYIRRVWATFRPSIDVPDGTLTVPQGSDTVQTVADVTYDARNVKLIGHSGAMQPVSRLTAETRDNYGVHNPGGTSMIQRADFNTLDNPFFWSSRPKLDRMSKAPAAGLHFVAFAATSDSYHRVRLAMDGRYPGGVTTPLSPHAEEQGLNSVLRTTHRQNFLVPPRAHRSFPLSELL